MARVRVVPRLRWHSCSVPRAPHCHRLGPPGLWGSGLRARHPAHEGPNQQLLGRLVPEPTPGRGCSLPQGPAQCSVEGTQFLGRVWILWGQPWRMVEWAAPPFPMTCCALNCAWVPTRAGPISRLTLGLVATLPHCSGGTGGQKARLGAWSGISAQATAAGASDGVLVPSLSCRAWQQGDRILHSATLPARSWRRAAPIRVATWCVHDVT